MVVSETLDVRARPVNSLPLSALTPPPPPPPPPPPTPPSPPPPAGTSRKEITEHWEWLEHNLLQTLSIFDNENDITTFVKGKVQVRKK